jgi:LuxR family maltose regulon positive regulatory protein
MECAALLIEQVAADMAWRFEARTLLGWLHAFPEETLHIHPTLLLFRALALSLLDHLDAAEACMQQAEDAFSATPQVGRAFRGERAAVQALIASFRADLPHAIAFSQQALTFLTTRQTLWRALLSLGLGDAYCQSDCLRDARHYYAQAARDSQAIGSTHLALLAGSSNALSLVELGRLRQAMQVYRHSLHLASEDYDRLPLTAGSLYVGMAAIQCEWNDLAGARGSVLQGLDLHKQWGNPVFLVGGYHTLSWISQEQGAELEALTCLREAERYMQKQAMPASLLIQHARLWLSQGDSAAATYWLGECALHLERARSYTQILKHLARARVYLVEGRLDEAMNLLLEVQRSREAAGQMGRVLEALILQALIWQARGDLTKATSTLEDALLLAEPEDYQRSFAGRSALMTKLLIEVQKKQRHHESEPKRRISSSYLETLLSLQPAHHAPVHSNTRLVEPLSERELEVLRLLATGMSNQGIAGSLLIALSTAKWYVRTIFEKLGVHSRTQAVARARELRLL